MNNDNYWYNIKEENGIVTIEKKPKLVLEEQIPSNDFNYVPKPYKKSRKMQIIPIIIIIAALPILLMLLFNYGSKNTNNPNKYRTVMIYMVGSDLESEGSMATYDLADINPNKIDLENINVLLMVGGSKTWHNYVDSNEIGLYELRSEGFKKIESYSLTSMGDVKTLSTFLNYTLDNYNSEKYDLMFWNHGLGALGLEADEVAEDYINIVELDKVFSETDFNNNKLELVIFNNCLSGNVHFASVMSKYADYMVASEEVMYVGYPLDRLNFLEKIEKNDTGIDIGRDYIDTNDNSFAKVNRNSREIYDSTLSIIDLSKIGTLESDINNFFNSIDLYGNYLNILRTRMNTYTYGNDEYNVYDTVDLYEAVDALAPYSSDSSIATKIKSDLNSAVVYNSALNNHSNGISIYFPFYGIEDYIYTHLFYFDKLWKNGYTEFMNNYFNYASEVKRAHRSGSVDNINHLENPIEYEDGVINISLSEEEADTYQRANIYIFDKANDKYKLLLKSDEMNLEDNILSFEDFNVLKSSNNFIVSTTLEKGKYKVYGKSDTDLLINVYNDNGNGEISNVSIDSNNKPKSGIVDFENLNITYYNLNYDIYKNETINEEYDIEKVEIDNKTNDLLFTKENFENHYVLIELFDINNDVFYSEFKLIN